MTFKELSVYLKKLEKTPSRNEITSILSELFKKSSEGEIDKITYLVLGSLAPGYQGVVFNIAERMMLRIIAQAYDEDINKVRALYKQKGDLGTVAEELATGAGGSISVGRVYSALVEIANEAGEGSQEKKISRMAKLLGELTPLGARFVARIPVGKLRLGFSDMTILDALSYLVKGDKSARGEIEAAFNVFVDIGVIAKTVKTKGLPGLKGIKPTAGIPIRPSLAERLPSAEKILEKIGPKVAVEPKYDGFRCIIGHTPIYVKSKGYLSVKDVKAGDFVLTHKGRFRKVMALNKRTIDKKERLFSLQSYLGNRFKISQGHRILTWKAGKSHWMPVEKVSVGDELVFPRPKLVEKKGVELPNPHLVLGNSSGYFKAIRTDESFYRLLGYWIGDGYTNNYHNTERIGLIFNAKTGENLKEEYKKIIKRNLGIASVSESIHGGASYIYWRDKPFREWLSGYFRREWVGKTLPEWFVGIGKEAFLQFLRGWIESDGTPRHGGGFRITTKERDLAALVQLIGLYYGKIIGVRKVRQKISKIAYKGTYYELVIPGTEKKARILGDKILVKVLRKEEIKRPDTRIKLYNLQVEGDESYCTGMIVLHNCQIHIFKEGKEKKVVLFSRNLENTTRMFPDLTQTIATLKVKTAIFDAEAIGYEPGSGKFLPFQETAQRKRKHDIEEIAKKLPLKLFAFDILYKDGKSYLQTPFSERRKILEATIGKKSEKLETTRQEITDSAERIRDLIKTYLSEGLEGALIKKIDAPYKAGARGYHWIKYKKNTGEGVADTIDCLVLGVNKGRGKRAGFGVGAFLVGVKEGEEFKSVSKIGTGLTDEQWRELDKRARALEIGEKPGEYKVHKNLTPDVWVKPSLVVEILADEITRSPVHTAGLALRFPRLIRFRDEKNPEQSTTLAELTRLYEMQKA